MLNIVNLFKLYGPMIAIIVVTVTLFSAEAQVVTGEQTPAPLSDESIAKVLGNIVLLSLFVERALALIFEWRPFLEKTKDKSIKEPISAICSIAVVTYVGFDALELLFETTDNYNWVGYTLTGLIVAGGSKGSISLFRDVLGWKSSARKEHEDQKKKVQ